MNSMITLAFRAVAMAMAAACIILAALKVTNTETYVILLSVGLLSLTLAAFIQRRD